MTPSASGSLALGDAGQGQDLGPPGSHLVPADAAVRTLGASDEASELTTQYEALLATCIREMWWQDADGQTIVDYMGKTFKDRISNVVDRGLIHDAQQFAERSFRQFEAQGDAKLASRYARLVAYIERRIDVWI